jgi:asparagine synthase (glutamine-hydrolysing)
MCGIFALLNYKNEEEPNADGSSTSANDSSIKKPVNKNTDQEFIKAQFEKGQHRGPEFSEILLHEEEKYIQGFHRLAINGLTSLSNQPLNIWNCSLICNGEIYNYKKLYELMKIEPKTESDCEVIVYLYRKYGIEHAIKMLDGVFSFILYDYEYNTIFVARDPYGVRPLYYFSSRDDSGVIGYASELKMLCEMANVEEQPVMYFPTGSYVQHVLIDGNWIMCPHIKYHIPSFAYSYPQALYELQQKTRETIFQYYIAGIHDKLESAVKKRYLNTERPIACLLSGGLDSSLITAMVQKIHSRNIPKGYTRPKVNLETYSIGLPDSEDLAYARMVANYIKSNHTEITVSEDVMIDVIPEVIKAIESYDVTTIRASLGNYLLGKFISRNSNAKVIFNGDGSDEVCGGYLYMNKCPDSIEFDRETHRLLRDIYMYDVLRSDKSISSNGLEPRTPFLDKEFVNFYLSIPVEFRNHNVTGTMEKFLLRSAFQKDKLLPDEILWRKKEAFSDGVSTKSRSLFTVLQESIVKTFMVDSNLSPREKEKLYYKHIFDKEFPNQSHIMSYYWMPKYVSAKDPSARTLAIYDDENATDVDMDDSDDENENETIDISVIDKEIKEEKKEEVKEEIKEEIKEEKKEEKKKKVYKKKEKPEEKPEKPEKPEKKEKKEKKEKPEKKEKKEKPEKKEKKEKNVKTDTDKV